MKTLKAITLLSIVGMASSASADIYNHIEHLTRRLEGKARHIKRDANHHLRGAACLPQLVCDLEDMCKLAIHLRGVARCEGPSARMQADLDGMDRLVARIRNTLRGLARDPHFAHVTRYSSRPHILFRRLGEMDEIIHHLHSDLAKLAAVHHPVHRFRPVPLPAPLPAPVPAPVYRPNPWRGPSYAYRPSISFGTSGIYYNGRGFSFGFGR